MVTEYKLSYTASEINEKLGTVDETKNALENDYYTSADLDTQLINKADLVDGKVPVEQLPDNIGGGVSSWNELEDKPFGESGWVIEWNGDRTDKEVFNCFEELSDCYKVSSSIFSQDDLVGASIKFYFDGNVIEDVIPSDVNSISIYQTNRGNLIVTYCDELPLALIVSNTGEDGFNDFSFNIPSVGVWFCTTIDTPEEYTCCLQNYSIKQLDSRFIPANLDFDLSDYYTKVEIDSILGDCSTVLDEISILIGE